MASTRNSYPVAKVLPREPKPAQLGRFLCRTEPRNGSLKLPCEPRDLSPRSWHTNTVFCCTQRPKGLMENELFS